MTLGRHSVVVVLAAAMLAAPGLAAAESCWTHNGSLMRLGDNGDKRWFTYEVPREVLKPAGVEQGTLLFEGAKVGNRYVGTARVFSRACPGNPAEYGVAGPIDNGGLRVTLVGERKIFKDCQPTVQTTTDVLVFDYSHRC